jgi:predicted alpha-1,6-mannanase (GH76 family)
MKRVLFFILVVCLCTYLPVEASGKSEVKVGFSNQQKNKNSKEIKSNTYWQELAEGMSQALIKHFWGANFEGYPDRYYFNYESDLANMTTNHYWPQAHAMDVIVDAYKRTSDEQYLNFYPLWWIGAPKFNFSGKEIDPWWNEFVDDMEWIALAQLRMFETTSDEKYYLKAKQLYNDWIWPTWGPENEEPWKGGITWKTDVRKSKNACSNGPAAIIAARLYEMYDKIEDPGKKTRRAYLRESIKIYSWLRNNLYDEATGRVFDNMNLQGRVSPDIYTYNQGTFIGAACELYRITGDEQYLKEAVNAANYVVDSMSVNNGVLRDASGGDGGLFHGIFFRYFVKLINQPDLDRDTRKKFHDYITNCAIVMAENGVNKESKLYGGKWWSAPTSTKGVSLTAHLSGCMLIEAMCVLEPLK